MSAPRRIAIIGAGAAGASAARSLRRLGYAGQLTVLDGDQAGSYERPPLSKTALLQPATVPEDFSLLKAGDMHDLGIEAQFGDPAVSLDAAARLIVTASGQTVLSDRILLALGGEAKQLPLPGSEVEGVFTLRDFADAEALRKRLGQIDHMTVVGGGLIGAECVACGLKLGKKVLWIDAAPAPLAHILPSPLAKAIVETHLTAGAELITNAAIAGLESNAGGVTGVRFEGGDLRSTDLVVFGVGMAPRLGLADAAGLALAAGGVKVDAQQETSATGIYAAGDVAAIPAGQGWQRHEHWRAAEVQGEAAAHGMLGLAYDAPDASWFWSDQGDHHVEMVGRKGERSVLRVGPKSLASFEFDSGILVGAASLNDPNAVRVAIRLLKAGKTPSETALADPDQDLRKLMRA